MYEKVYDKINNMMKTMLEAKKRGWYDKYNQLAVIRASFQLGECEIYKLPENKKFLTKDAEFLTKLYNFGADDEYYVKFMMKVMYGDKFDRMIKKYIG